MSETEPMEPIPPPPLPPLPPVQLSCPVCAQPMALSEFEAGPQLCPCPRSTRFEAVLFRPAGAAVPVVRELGLAGGQPCARHEGNAASANCERCGVFMCELCEIRLDDKKLCPDCFDRLAAGGELRAARGRRRDWSALSYLSALLGLLLSCFGAGLVLGPAAVYFALRSLREKRALGNVGGTASDYVAIGFGVLVTVGTVAGIATLMIGAFTDG